MLNFAVSPDYQKEMNDFYRILLPVFIALLLGYETRAQLLLMRFESDSSTTVIGPSPSGMSNSAGTITGGSSGKGLAARRNSSEPKLDLNMDFANTSNYWDVSGIDVSIDFNREESVGDFFTRLSNNFRLGMNGGNLQVRYQVDNGAGGSNTINSGNIQGIPNDDTWRRYRFTYDPNTGIGTVYVDGTSVWTNDGPDNRPLYWNGAGAMRIGDQMDASGSVEAIFDSLYITSISVLPVELVESSANRIENDVEIQWRTASEINNDYFSVERSSDLEQWQEILSIEGAGNSNTLRSYLERDYQAPKENLFYRIKQVDYDGVYTYSDQLFVPFKDATSEDEVIFKTFPNPVERGNRLKLVFENMPQQDLLLVLQDMNGRELYMKTIYIASDKVYEVVDVSETIPAGQYIITATSNNKIYNNKIFVR